MREVAMSNEEAGGKSVADVCAAIARAARALPARDLPDFVAACAAAAAHARARIVVETPDHEIALQDRASAALIEQSRTWGEIYKEKHNPLIAWSAFQVFRDWQAPIPEWVHDYFARVAAGLDTLGDTYLRHRIGKRRVGIAQRIAEIVMDSKRAGRGGVGRAFAQRAADKRDSALVKEVEGLMAAEGYAIYAACERVSELHARRADAVSATTIKRAYRAAQVRRRRIKKVMHI